MTELGTYGVMIEEGILPTPFCLTLELRWFNNIPNLSCIPKGEYTCKKIISPSRGEVYEILNVPNRTNILIHKGNFGEDSLGCIIIGEQFEDVLNPKADKVITSVLSSGAAFHEFMKVRLYNQEQFSLVIKEV